ncbi:secreted trypsin-like serine protease [Psychromicrobium silvestre]|uniref:Secreted trypsin-like serine protease n=1 Tax=Psychromicrobium silvestre TaxID=1645614 RepID=A0A7Y9LTS0_9MICC|nr:S1 family peptidase [Psychromicrobium silvestre]NYE95370.1 secreted trypsin-like serine protease [Psychromicrobium silvestre]
MNKIFKSVLIGAGAATLALLGGGAATAAPVSGGGATTNIVGGTQAPATPWAVQLIFQQGGTDSYGCTGEAISASWILTAKHCVDGTTAMNVYFSNSTSNRGTAIKADQLKASPYGDVALVHLSTAHALSSYPALAASYAPTVGATGTIMGYGLRANQTPSTGLYQANIKVLGTSSDAYGGPAVHIQGVSGAANHGDSGGPLIIGGKIVGVCSTGDSADPGSNTQAGSNYANLTTSRSWITSTSGV